MLAITEAELLDLVSSFAWPLARVSAFFMVLPIIGTQLVSARVRAGLAVLVTLVVMPLLPAMPTVDLLSLRSVALVAEQAVIGATMAFVLVVLFQVFILAGQMIAMQMGLGFASMMDPANGIAVAIVSQFYLMLTTLMFLSFDGHLIAIEVMVESFYVMPVSGTWAFEGLYAIAGLGSWLFASALFVALPAVTAILIINFAFGVMTRAAPQLNVFALGFPFTMLMGLLIMYLGLGGFLPQYERLAAEALSQLRDMYAI